MNTIASEDALWEACLQKIHQARPLYFKLNNLAATSPGDLTPEDLCENLHAELFSTPHKWTDETINEFLNWAANKRPVCKLSLILAARAALARGDREAAMPLASTALRLMQNNLHVQSVYRKAHGLKEIELKGRYCRAPFERLETAPDGSVYFCCPAWLPVPIGNIGDGDAKSLWNSPPAQEIRRSVLAGEYKYCSRMHCPRLTNDDLPEFSDIKNPVHKEIVEDKRTDIDTLPRKLVLSHDRSCNLACPSCRTEIIIARKAEQQRLNQVFHQSIEPLMTDAERLLITASGDPFGSNHFRYVLKNLNRSDYPNLRLDLQTNGVLFDERAWDELDFDNRVERISVSIDAINPATYAVLRRGGDFKRLMKNLKFLSTKHREGRFKMFRLDCVVQTLNFREMPEIAQLARQLGCDGVKFQMIRNWNTYSPQQFAQQFIGAPEHPQYQEFTSVLADPVLQWTGVEIWGGVDRPNTIPD